MRITFLLIATALLVVACGSPSAEHSEDDIAVAEDVLTIAFEDPTTFETGQHNEGASSLAIEEGVYTISHTAQNTSYIWGQGGDDVAANVQIEATASATGEPTNNLYGVMCRVDEGGAGYAFLVSNDGFGAIARTDGRSLTFLFDWHENSAINESGDNTLRAICIDDYLALYVNDEFIGDASDDRFVEAGQIGLLAGIFVTEAGASGNVEATFDDLTVAEASLQ